MMSGFQAVFYRDRSGCEPVRELIAALDEDTQAALEAQTIHSRVCGATLRPGSILSRIRSCNLIALRFESLALVLFGENTANLAERFAFGPMLGGRFALPVGRRLVLELRLDGRLGLHSRLDSHRRRRSALVDLAPQNMRALERSLVVDGRQGSSLST